MKETRCFRVCFTAIAVLMLFAGCGTAPYQPAPLNVDSLRQRAETQSFAPLTVKAAVPDAAESERLFGLPLYEHEVQPVWLEISNQGEETIRFSVAGVDPDYYSPLEVSYKLRKGFSRVAREAIDERFHQSAITRYAKPGETISGFVFTHLSPGTKSFNVDLFGLTTRQNFAFFIRVPGFLPDHADVGFDRLYAPDEIRDLSIDEFRQALYDLPHNTTDANGQSIGLPVNVVIIGHGIDVLRALLRADWYESPAGGSSKTSASQMAYHLYKRKPDAVFRIKRNKHEPRNELRAWLAPLRVDGEPVWLAQVTNFIGQRSYFGEVFFGANLDPDVDDARDFILQNIWYSQGLQSFAWSKAEPISFDQPRADFNGNLYYSDGLRAVLWLSGEPYSLLDTTMLEWEEAPIQ